MARVGWMVLVVAVIGQVACSVETGQDFRYAGQGIYYGSADTNPDHDGVVLILASNMYLCTGTLITDRVILTAAHCLPSNAPENYQVFFGPSMDNPSAMREVSAILEHPDYDSNTFENDLGLVRMSNPAPAGVQPLPYLTADMALSAADVGIPLELVGYGQTETGTTGTKLHVNNSIDFVCASADTCTYHPPLWATAQSICYTQQPGGTCSGDSGGPGFVQIGGQDYVAGVTSYVFNLSGGDLCAEYGCSIKVDAFQTFIEDFIGLVGSQCASNDECQAGLCEDGICCQSACPNACQICNAPGLEGTCSTAPEGWSCQDADVCNGDETCVAGVCTPGAEMVCDDGDACTNNTCHAANGCIFIPSPNGTSCSDADLCNGEETCQSQQCVANDPLDCDDGNPCTSSTCDPVEGCQAAYLPDGQDCSEADPCLGSGSCQSGVCVIGAALDCDDADACTQDVCVPFQGCSHDPLDCDDGEECTQNDCDPGSGCLNSPAPAGTECGEGLCSGTCTDGTCGTAGLPLCDDAEPCTRDSCDPAFGCRNDAFQDGKECGDCMICEAGKCGTSPSCKGSSGCSSSGPGQLLFLPLLIMLLVRRRIV